MANNFINLHSSIPLISIFGVTAIGLITIAYEKTTISKVEATFLKTLDSELPKDFADIYKKMTYVELSPEQPLRITRIYHKDCVRWVRLNFEAEISYEQAKVNDGYLYNLSINTTEPTGFYYQEYPCN